MDSPQIGFGKPNHRLPRVSRPLRRQCGSSHLLLAPPTVWKGVGGALLFFCISFTILLPLWFLSQYARFQFRMGAPGVIGLVRLAFGVLVGIMLWTRQSAAMVLLRIHLAVTALFTAYNLITVLLFVVPYSYPRLATLPIFLSIAASLVFLLSAIVYFSVSERVRATYGSKLFG